MTTTLHRAPVVLTMTGPPLRDAGVLVAGSRVLAVGAGLEPGSARVRQHRGVLLPGLVDAGADLDRVPAGLDPAERRGEPGSDEDVAALARGAVHALLRAGTTAVAAGSDGPGLQMAARSGLRTAVRPDLPDAALLSAGSPAGTALASGGSDGLDLLATAAGLLTLLPAEALLRAATVGGAALLGLPGSGRLVEGGRADLVVLDVPTDGDPYDAVVRRGAGRCVLTVVGGRLLHRR